MITSICHELQTPAKIPETLFILCVVSKVSKGNAASFGWFIVNEAHPVSPPLTHRSEARPKL